MGRYIDEDAFIRDLQERYCRPLPEQIVRCKECKHNPKHTGDYMFGICVFCCEEDFYATTPPDEFFCGYGERSEP